MEVTTVTIEAKATSPVDVPHLSRLWVGEEEIPAEGLTVLEVLTDMQEMGWHLRRVSITPLDGGVRMIAHFLRGK